MFRIYTTTGTYPSLAKSSTLLWTGLQTSDYEFTITKNIEDDDIIAMPIPQMFDNISLEKTFDLNGVVINDTTSILDKFKVLEALSYYSGTWKQQIEYGDTIPVVLAVEIDFPGLAGVEILTKFIIIKTIKLKMPLGAPKLSYTISCKEISNVTGM